MHEMHEEIYKLKHVHVLHMPHDDRLKRTCSLFDALVNMHVAHRQQVLQQNEFKRLYEMGEPGGLHKPSLEEVHDKELQQDVWLRR